MALPEQKPITSRYEGTTLKTRAPGVAVPGRPSGLAGLADYIAKFKPRHKEDAAPARMQAAAMDPGYQQVPTRFGPAPQEPALKQRLDYTLGDVNLYANMLWGPGASGISAGSIDPEMAKLRRSLGLSAIPG